MSQPDSCLFLRQLIPTNAQKKNFVYLMSSFVPFFSSHSDESLLYSSLRASLQHPSCASAEWLKNCNISSCHFSTLSAWDNSAYWENKRHENLCMAFPAILDLKGSYSRIGPTFNLADSENVCVKIPLI